MTLVHDCNVRAAKPLMLVALSAFLQDPDGPEVGHIPPVAREECLLEEQAPLATATEVST